MNIAVEDGSLSLLGLKSVSSLTSGEVGDFLLKLLFEVKRTNFMSNYINTKFTYLSIFQYSGRGNGFNTINELSFGDLDRKPVGL